jgi:hypothetical protein
VSDISKFNEIRKFLFEHEILLQTECLETFDELPKIYKSFLDDLKKLNLKELHQFSTHPYTSKKFSFAFCAFLEKIKSLEKVTKYDVIPTKLEPSLARKLRPKKNHELSLLKTLLDRSQSKTMLDVGGGIGHLSNVFVHKKDKKAYCLDIDVSLQEVGRSKILKWIYENKDKIEFINEDLFNCEKSFSVDLICGLHSCGELSNKVIDLYLESKTSEIINFGCCYHKIEKKQNISNEAKKKPLLLSFHALTLATRSNSIYTYEEFLKRFRIKQYRYTIHLYITEELRINDYKLKACHEKDYTKSFSEYVSIVYEKKVDLRFLEEYIKIKEERVLELFYIDFIRDLLGRITELYILLDRKLYLQERGKQVVLRQIFDQNLSPRNIALMNPSFLL